MIVADSGSIISLAINCLSCVIARLGTEIIVTQKVYDEIITRPMSSKKYGLEALRIKKLFNDGTLQVKNPRKDLMDEFLDLANTLYTIKGKPLKIIHQAEAEAVALVKDYGAEALLIDERSTRMIIEDPEGLGRFLTSKNNKRVDVNGRVLRKLKVFLPNTSVIRSTEVAAVAYEKGLLDGMYGEDGPKVLAAALSALKLSGCSISWDEVDEYTRILA